VYCSDSFSYIPRNDRNQPENAGKLRSSDPVRVGRVLKLMPRERHLHQALALAPTTHRYTQTYSMETAQQTPEPGSLSWKLSSHPITLLTFLFFRICTSKHTPSNPRSPNPDSSFRAISDYVRNSLPFGLPLRPPPLHLQLRPHLHNHHPAPSHRLLLPQEHRRTPARWAPLVERSRLWLWRFAMGV
jgi:hypothetical protein